MKGAIWSGRLRTRVAVVGGGLGGRRSRTRRPGRVPVRAPQRRPWPPPWRPSRSAESANVSATSACMGSTGEPCSTPILSPSTPRSRPRLYSGTGRDDADGSRGSGPARNFEGRGAALHSGGQRTQMVERPRQRGHPGSRHPPVGGLEPDGAAQRRPGCGWSRRCRCRCPWARSRPRPRPPEPPLEPPGTRRRSHGLDTGGGVDPAGQLVGCVVLPTMTAPPACSRRTSVASEAAGVGPYAGEPHRVGSPAMSTMSLTPTGTPMRGPRSRPAAMAPSAASAASRAPPVSMITNADRSGFNASAAARLASVSSRLVLRPERSAVAASGMVVMPTSGARRASWDRTRLDPTRRRAPGRRGWRWRRSGRPGRPRSRPGLWPDGRDPGPAGGRPPARPGCERRSQSLPAPITAITSTSILRPGRPRAAAWQAVTAGNGRPANTSRRTSISSAISRTSCMK